VTFVTTGPAKSTLY